MNYYQVQISYKRGSETLEQYFTVISSDSYQAKLMAKRLLNRQGIYGTFTYQVYKGNNADAFADTVF